MAGELIIDCSGNLVLDCSKTNLLINCVPYTASYTSSAVAHFRAGNGRSSGDWEIGIGPSTQEIKQNGQIAWPNNSYVDFSLYYSGPNGGLTASAYGTTVMWAPSSSIPNDSSSYRVRIDYSASPGYTSQIATENVTLTINNTTHSFADMLVTSGESTSSFSYPHQLGIYSWMLSGSIGLGWSGSYPNASRLQTIVRVQRQVS